MLKFLSKLAESSACVLQTIVVFVNAISRTQAGREKIDNIQTLEEQEEISRNCVQRCK